MPRLYDDDGSDDLLAFAEAVGNFNDVAADSRNEPDAVDAGPGIFDFEDEHVEPPREADAQREPEAPSAGAIVPVIGMRMAAERVDLGFASLIRAGALDDAPREVVGASHNVFAAIDCGPGPQAPVAATEGLERVVTALRLLKPGGVGLGAYGWSREATTWRRFSTGAGSPRPGGYELSEAEVEGLQDLSEGIARRRAKTPAFAWALSRFDLGAERPNQVEALSDYLLAVRALLEGGGPAKAALSARVGALCAGSDERAGVRDAFEHAVALERTLMGGDRVHRTDGSPVKAIGAVEETLRFLLRGMADGELGSDLRVTADEILLADGLRTGGASSELIGGTAEWRIADTDETAEWRIPDLEDAERIVADQGEFSQPTPTKPLEPVPDQTPDLFGAKGGLNIADVETATGMGSYDDKPAPPPWLEEREERELEWPSFAGPRPKSRKRNTADHSERVDYLFPKADLDWSVGEMGTKRRRRSA